MSGPRVGRNFLRYPAPLIYSNQDSDNYILQFIINKLAFVPESEHENVMRVKDER
jgi:hypothetical protein